jgi:CRISPR-associated endonuclease/helicase Cas3
VLEHHSTYIHPGESDDNADQRLAQEALRVRLAIQNWDAPMVVTTAIQFFESLFASQASRCRKLHNICNSVVILDEAQMIPLELLEPSVAALKELARAYNATILLCSATQPALDEGHYLSCGFSEKQIQEIIDVNDLPNMFTQLKRVKLHWRGSMSNQEIVDEMLACNNVLTIVNTKNEAKLLFRMLGPGEGHFHLSARMYPQHRREVLREINNRLQANKTCRVVSTSLVEAGVDVDFATVYRAVTGLDSIAQAAGRCNREGKDPKGYGDVHVYIPASGIPKNYPSFNRRFSATEPLLKSHEDFLSPEVMRRYFCDLYSSSGKLDQQGIMKLINNVVRELSNCPFNDIAGRYRFIEDGQIAVIIAPAHDAKATALLEKLRCFENTKKTLFAETKKILRQLQNYTINLYTKEFNFLRKQHAVELVNNQFWVTVPQSDYYDDDLGLVLEGEGYVDDDKFFI